MANRKPLPLKAGIFNNQLSFINNH